MSVINATDTAKSLGVDKGKDEILMLATLQPQDVENQDDETSLFSRQPEVACRNYFEDWVDVDPVKEVKFGSNAVFRYGDEGSADLSFIELYTVLPKVGDNTDPVGPDLHPSEAGYVGGGASGAFGGAEATFCDWQPFIGELIMGGAREGDVLRQRHATEITDEYTAISKHVQRLLFQNNEGTAIRAAYENAVGAIPDSTVEPVHTLNSIHLAHADDDLNYHKLIPVHAFGLEFEISFRFPTIAELVQTDILPANLVALDSGGNVGGQPECFLRCHYVNTEADERAAHANETLEEGGIHYKTMSIVHEAQVNTSNPAAHRLLIDIENSKNPAVAVIAIARLLDDVQPVGATAEATDAISLPLFPQLRSVGGLLTRPDWTRLLPLSAWTVTDANGSKRIKPLCTANYWQTSRMGHVKYFPSTPTDKIAVVPFSIEPTQESHALGHTTFASMKKAKFELHLPALPTNIVAGTRVIDIFTLERNGVVAQGGTLTRDWQ